MRGNQSPRASAVSGASGLVSSTMASRDRCSKLFCRAAADPVSSRTSTLLKRFLTSATAAARSWLDARPSPSHTWPPCCVSKITYFSTRSPNCSKAAAASPAPLQAPICTTRSLSLPVLRRLSGSSWLSNATSVWSKRAERHSPLSSSHASTQRCAACRSRFSITDMCTLDQSYSLSCMRSSVAFCASPRTSLLSRSTIRSYMLLSVLDCSARVASADLTRWSMSVTAEARPARAFRSGLLRCCASATIAASSSLDGMYTGAVGANVAAGCHVAPLPAPSAWGCLPVGLPSSAAGRASLGPCRTSSSWSRRLRFSSSRLYLWCAENRSTSRTHKAMPSRTRSPLRAHMAWNSSLAIARAAPRYRRPPASRAYTGLDSKGGGWARAVTRLAISSSSTLLRN
mmetsp:Transcript_21945/g.62405  ORF Transcript_21945/g.62405 Transcript_21945/m.62405 type:complete len:400 (+) Transcript_21945:138-1337(+)